MVTIDQFQLKLLMLKIVIFLNGSNNNVLKKGNCSIFIHLCVMIVHRVLPPQQLTQKTTTMVTLNTYTKTPGNDIWEEINGFTEIYRCATYIYFSLLLAHDFG